MQILRKILTIPQRASAIKNFFLGKSSDLNFFHEITLLKHALGSNAAMSSYFLKLLVGIVVIDQNITSGERDCLFRIGGYFGVNTSELEILIDKRLREISPREQSAQPGTQGQPGQQTPHTRAQAETGAAQPDAKESSPKSQAKGSRMGWVIAFLLVIAVIGGGGWWAYHNKIFVDPDALHKFCDLHNNDIACYRLATRYAQGKGVPQNALLAQKYFQRGCELHNAKACSYIAQANQTVVAPTGPASETAPAPQTPATSPDMSEQEIEQLRSMLLEGVNSRNVLNIETQDQEVQP